MSRHSDREVMAIASSYIEIATNELEAQQFAVEFRTDLEYWTQIIANGEGSKHRNAAFDPQVSDTRCAGFLRVAEFNGTTIGVCAIKRWITDDFLADFSDQSLWMGESAKQFPSMELLPETRAVPPISGVCTYAGGLWIRPDKRGSRLSALMSPLTRAWGVFHWLPTWACGTVTTMISKAGFPLDQYQYAHVVQATEQQYYAVSSRPMSLALPWDHIDEWADRTKELVAARRATFDHDTEVKQVRTA